MESISRAVVVMVAWCTARQLIVFISANITLSMLAKVVFHDSLCVVCKGRHSVHFIHLHTMQCNGSVLKLRLKSTSVFKSGCWVGI